MKIGVFVDEEHAGRRRHPAHKHQATTLLFGARRKVNVEHMLASIVGDDNERAATESLIQASAARPRVDCGGTRHEQHQEHGESHGFRNSGRHFDLQSAMVENSRLGIVIAASPLISPSGATQYRVPVIARAFSCPAKRVWAETSVQQESRFGVLKNRPLPSTVAVTLLGSSRPTSSARSAGIAIMMASISPDISPAKTHSEALAVRSQHAVAFHVAGRPSNVGFDAAEQGRSNGARFAATGYRRDCDYRGIRIVLRLAGGQHCDDQEPEGRCFSHTQMFFRGLMQWNGLLVVGTEANTTELSVAIAEKMMRLVGLAAHPL